jgi:hypothetical protein
MTAVPQYKTFVEAQSSANQELGQLLAEALLLSVLQTHQVSSNTGVSVKATASMIVSPESTTTTVYTQTLFDAPLTFSPSTADAAELRAREALNDKYQSLFNQTAVYRGLTPRSS